jgi:predicted porin
MDSMILDVISEDREAQSWASGLSYSKNNFDFLYAYAQFKGSANSENIKEFITEHNVVLTYTYQKHITLGLIYANLHNKKNTLTNDGTWDNFRILLSYEF